MRQSFFATLPTTTKYHFITQIDTWAFGCVLYYLCNLKPPFRAKTIIELGQKIVRDRPSPLHASYSSDLRDLIDLLLQKDDLNRPELEQIECLKSFRLGRERAPLLLPSQLKQKQPKSEILNAAGAQKARNRSQGLEKATPLSEDVQLSVQSQPGEPEVVEKHHQLHQRKESSPTDQRGNNLESDMNEEYCNERNFDLISKNFRQFSLQSVNQSDNDMILDSNKERVLTEKVSPQDNQDTAGKLEKELKKRSMFSRPLRSDPKYKIKNSSKRKEGDIEAILLARENIARELKGVGTLIVRHTREDNPENNSLLEVKDPLGGLKLTHRRDFQFSFNKLTTDTDPMSIIKNKRSENSSAKKGQSIMDKFQSNLSPKQSQILPVASERAKTALAHNRPGKNRVERPVSSMFKNHVIYQKEETKNRLLSAISGIKMNLAPEKPANFFEPSPMAIGRLSRVKDQEALYKSTEISRQRLRVSTATQDRRVMSGKTMSSHLSDAIFRSGTNRYTPELNAQLSPGNPASIQRLPESSLGFKKMTIHDL